MGKRAFGEIEKLPSGRYRARYTGEDMRRHSAPNTFLTKQHAEYWLAKEEELVSRGIWTPPEARAAKQARNGLTVDEWLERTISERRTRKAKPIKATTADHYERTHRLAIPPPTLGGLRLVEF